MTPAAAEDQPDNGVPGIVEDQEGAAETAGAGMMEGGTSIAAGARAVHPRDVIEEEEEKEGLEPVAVMGGAVGVVMVDHRQEEGGGTEQRCLSPRRFFMCEMWGIRSCRYVRYHMS